MRERWEREQKGYIRTEKTDWELFLLLLIARLDSTRMYINIYMNIYSTNTTQCFACLSFNNIFVFFFLLLLPWLPERARERKELKDTEKTRKFIFQCPIIVALFFIYLHESIYIFISMNKIISLQKNVSGMEKWIVCACVTASIGFDDMNKSAAHLFVWQPNIKWLKRNKSIAYEKYQWKMNWTTKKSMLFIAHTLKWQFDEYGIVWTA